MAWEVRFLYWLQTYYRSPQRTCFWYAVTWCGYAASMPVLASAILLLIPEYQMTGWASLSAIGIIEVLFNHILKRIISRERPFVAHPELTAIGRLPKDKSFPSGHTSSAFACALIFALRLSLWAGIPALVFAAMIAFSRLYLSVHYPTDVIGGILAAVIVDRIVLILY